ncbi:MAG: stage II sporulation protein P [Clostridium sp.]
MFNRKSSDILSKFIVFAVGILLMAKIFLPLLSMGLSENPKYIYMQILGKSNGSIEEHVAKSQHEDEDNVDLSSYIIRNLTGIDLSTPTNFMSSQMPLLGLLDIDITGEDKGPIIVDNNKGSDSSSENAEDKSPPAKPLDRSKPEILIYHTHTTETYNPEGKGKDFTTDLSKTVASVGDELVKILENKYGIAVVHNKTVHDIPKRNGAYQRSRPTVEKLLKENKYKLVIDLHRDSVPADKSTALINGQKIARPMFVFGSNNPKIKDSEAIAKKLNNEINKIHPKFSRGFLYKKSAVFNQDLDPNLVLIELGSSTNSKEEVVASLNIIAKAIANTIK